VTAGPAAALPVYGKAPLSDQRRPAIAMIPPTPIGPGRASAEAADGVTVLDVVGLVTGGAVAAVHIRAAMPEGLSGAGWTLLWLSFAGIGLTAAGPFVIALRRLGRRTDGPARLGDRLWLALGLPWVASGLVRALDPSRAPAADGLGPADWILMIGLGGSCLVALVVVWVVWVADSRSAEAAEIRWSPWSQRVGLILAVAWPVQCGLGLIVLGGSDH